MFKYRATLSWVMLARFNAPPYVAVDYYMEAMPTPDPDQAVNCILTAGVLRLWRDMPRVMPVCQKFAARFCNLAEDGANMLAERELYSAKLIVHTILTDAEYRLLHPAARLWNKWLPKAETYNHFVRALDKWRELPPSPRPGTVVKPVSRKRIKAGRDTPALFS